MQQSLFTIAQIVTDKHLPGSSGSNATSDTIKVILTIIFTSIGALAVLFIVIAGLRYITAAGEPTKVAQAKNSILYALIGLIIAATADAIVNFIIGTL